MSLLSVLEGTAPSFLHSQLSIDAPFSKAVQHVSRQFSSENRQQQLLVQMHVAKLERFMNKRKHDSLFDTVDVLVAEMNRIVP